MSAAGVEFLHQLVVGLHAWNARGERLAGIHPENDREGILVLLRQLHERAAGINEENAWAHASESDRSALVNFNFQAVGNEAHHAGRFDPGDLLQLSLLLAERYEENVAADVGAH